MTQASAGTFSVNVLTSSHGGLLPEQVAELCVDRIIKIADTAPPELADQARVFRIRIMDVVMHHMKLAIAEDRQSLAIRLERSGFSDLAHQVRRL
jgi:hypothetical protein